MSEVCIGISAVSHGISVVFPRMQRCRQQQCTSPSVQSACSSSSFLSAGVPPHPVAARPTGGARSQQGLSARHRPRQGRPPGLVAAWPTTPGPFRRGMMYCAEDVLAGLPPPAVAAGPAASWRGGRCHVSPAAPAATAEGVLFNVFICR